MEKKSVPVWAVVASIAVALAFVAVLFLKGGTGDASEQELAKIRNNQRGFASATTPKAGSGGRDGGSGMPLGGPGAPPGAIVTPPGAGR